MTKKQVLLIVLSLGLFGAACLSGAIMAYHVYESKEAGNVFTVGDEKVETVESSWDTNDADHDGVPDNAAYIIQNQQIPKSVQAKNTGENEAMVFVKVTVPVKEVTMVLPDDTGEAYPEKHVGRSIISINY